MVIKLKNYKNKAKTIALTGCLAGIALVIFVLEAQLPPLMIPGAKLGLSNVVMLFAIYSVGKKEAFFILIVKVLLGSIYSGNPSSLIFSFFGGISAYTVMCLLSLFFRKNKLWVVSAFGGTVHNLGQLTAAWIVMDTPSVFAYTPYLIIAGIATGCFTGIAAEATVKHIKIRN